MSSRKQKDDAVNDELKAAYKAHKKGDQKQAESVYLKTLSTDPDSALALHYLGLLRYQQGDVAEAFTLLQKSISAAPQRADAHLDLGRICGMENRQSEAIEHFRTALSIEPDHADAWHNLGLSLQISGHRPEAFEALKTALRNNPTEVSYLHSLGRLLIELSQIDDAIRCFKLAIAHEKNGGPSRAILGHLLIENERHDEAQTYFSEATAQNPRDCDAWVGLGHLAEDKGQETEAERYYRNALSIVPGEAKALGRLLALKRKAAEAPLIQLAQHAIRSSSTPDEAISLVGYGAGKALEAQGDISAAFEAYDAANRARVRSAGKFDLEAYKTRIETIKSVGGIEAVSPELPHGSTSDIPIFIVGMPRSGTTLTEQILASHPEIFGAGELTAVSDAAARMGEFDPSTTTDVTSARALETATSETLSELASEYLTKLTQHKTDAHTRVIDKAPLNFFHLGLISRLFPNAKIIHCVRDPRDVCFSIFCENFSPQQRHAADLSDLAEYWKGYRDLIQHWSSVLSVPMLDVEYANTVDDVEAASKRICAFLQIEWDERCLSFHQNDRAVRTPSKWQVRQPIYKSAVARWKRFEPHLEPLLGALNAAHETPSSNRPLA